MNEAKIDKIKRFYSIAYSIQNRGGDFGVTKTFVEGLISEEFNVVSSDAIDRYYLELIKTNFIFSGLNGIKANSHLEKEFQKFSWELKKGDQ